MYRQGLGPVIEEAVCRERIKIQPLRWYSRNKQTCFKMIWFQIFWLHFAFHKRLVTGLFWNENLTHEYIARKSVQTYLTGTQGLTTNWHWRVQQIKLIKAANTAQKRTRGYGLGMKIRLLWLQKATVWEAKSGGLPSHLPCFMGKRIWFSRQIGQHAKTDYPISGKNPNILKMSLWWEKKRFTLQNENPMLDTGRSCIRQRWRFEDVLTWSWIELRIVLGHNSGGMRVLSSGSEASSGWRIKLEMTDGERKMKNSQINVKRNAIYTFIKKYEVFLQH